MKAEQAAGVTWLAVSHPVLATPARRHLNSVIIYDSESNTLATCQMACSLGQVKHCVMLWLSMQAFSFDGGQRTEESMAASAPRMQASRRQPQLCECHVLGSRMTRASYLFLAVDVCVYAEHGSNSLPPHLGLRCTACSTRNGGRAPATRSWEKTLAS